MKPQKTYTAEELSQQISEGLTDLHSLIKDYNDLAQCRSNRLIRFITDLASIAAATIQGATPPHTEATEAPPDLSDPAPDQYCNLKIQILPSEEPDPSNQNPAQIPGTDQICELPHDHQGPHQGGSVIWTEGEALESPSDPDLIVCTAQLQYNGNLYRCQQQEEHCFHSAIFGSNRITWKTGPYFDLYFPPIQEPEKP